MKKILSVMLMFAVMIFSANCQANSLTVMANGVTAQKFLSNWGFPNAWDSRRTVEGPPGLQTFFVRIPSASSGLSDMGRNLSGYGGLDVSVMPNSSEVVGIRLILSSSSNNPGQILGNATSAIIGRNNFNADKNKFYSAVSKVLSGQSNYEVYYSENMRRNYIIAIQPMDEQIWYKLSIYAYTGN